MTVVMASGHFDPFHPGHINYLLAAKDLGDSLIVAVDSDASVENKHPKLLAQIDRINCVAELSFVDSVVGSSGLDISEALERFRPDIYAIGPDHKPDEIPEYSTCTRLGIKIKCLDHLVKDKPGSVINKLKMVYSNRPTVVNAIIIDDLWPIVGIRNSVDGAGKSELIGGFVEPGETLEVALRREVLEETKSEVESFKYFGSWIGHYSDGRSLLSVVFIVKLKSEPQATDEVRNFVEVKNLPDNMFADCDLAALKIYLDYCQIVTI